MPAYRKQVVTFLDIMGFREIVKSQDADAITHTLDLIQSTAAAVEADKSRVKTTTISFSDSVIRARPCGDDPVAALLNEIRGLAKAQWDLMDSGVLIRGGMTIGDVLMVPTRAFGPAFVRAYELESSWARSPRLVIDPTTVSLIREQAKRSDGLASRRKLIKAVREHLKFDQDGLWFIDYVASAHRRLEMVEHRAGMARQRETIIENAASLKPDSPVLAKYLWLIRYFNGAVKHHYESDKALKIKRTDVPLSDELLLPRLGAPRVKDRLQRASEGSGGSG